MKMAYMFQGYPGPYSSYNSTSDATYGLKFQFEYPGVINNLVWYRSGNNELDTPTHIGLWDTVTESFVYETNVVSDDLFHGAQYVDLPSPAAVTDGRDYVLMVRLRNGGSNQGVFLSGGKPPIQDHGFFRSYPLTPSVTTTDAWPAVPSTDVPNFIICADCGFSIVAPDFTTPITEYTLHKALNDWLAGGQGAGMPVGFERGYIPDKLLNPPVTSAPTTDEIRDAVVGFGIANVSELSDYEHFQWDASTGKIASVLGFLGTLITIGNYLRDLWPTGHLPSDHDASLDAHRAATEPEGETLPSYIEGEIEIVLSAVTDQTNEITQILAHGNGTEDVPTIVGESDWSNIFRFDVPADFYTVDITTTDLDATSEDVGGTQVWDHLGFCVPLTVDGLPEYGPRLAIGGQVIRTGRQMGGIILNGRRVLSGHVTAYQYQAP